MYLNLSSNVSYQILDNERELIASIGRLSAMKSYSTIFIITIGILAFLANSLVLIIFLFRRHLVTSFTVHVLAITVINLCLTVVYLPMQVSKDWKRPRAGCAFFLYAQGSLIPHWYRRKRTIRMGMFQIALAVVYLNLWYLPQFVPNIALIPAMAVNGSLCGAAWHNTRYDNVVGVMNVLLPEGFMYVSYPVLLTLIYKRRLARLGEAYDIIAAHSAAVCICTI